MKVILRADVERVGKKGEVIDVADGFARNYLVPKGLALRASAGAQSQAAGMRRARMVKDTREREAAELVARKLVPAVIRIPARAGREGRLFGSVTTHDVADAVLAQTGIELDRRQLRIDEPIRTLGEHSATARLHAEVEFPISLDVVAK